MCTKGDPFNSHFNAAEVFGASTKRTSITALDTQKQSNFDRANGEDPYQGTSKSQGSLLRQKNRNRNSLYDRTNAADSVSMHRKTTEIRMKITPSINNSVETEAVAQALLYYIGCFFLADLSSVIQFKC